MFPIKYVQEPLFMMRHIQITTQTKKLFVRILEFSIEIKSNGGQETRWIVCFVASKFIRRSISMALKGYGRGE